MLKSVTLSLFFLFIIKTVVLSETFGGLGLKVAQIFDASGSMHEGNIVVLGVIPGTDAQKKGVLPGDVIIQIDGKSTSGRHFDDLIKNDLRGLTGSTAVLTIERFGSKEQLKVSVLRVELTAPSKE